jgi:hypothetical protein
MTYETDGGGFKGLRYRREDESIVTFRSSIAKHYVASLATLETATTNARARLSDYYDFKRTAIEEGGRGRVRRFVILPGTDAGRAAELVKVLLRAGIEVRQAEAGFRSTRAHAYTSDETRARDFPAGAYIVELAQPQMRLAKALLEPNTELDPSFAREQTARLRRNERRGAKRLTRRLRLLRHHRVVAAARLRRRSVWTEDAGAVNAAPLKLEESAEAQTQNQARTQPSSAHSGATTSALAPGGVTGRASVAYIIPVQLRRFSRTRRAPAARGFPPRRRN